MTEPAYTREPLHGFVKRYLAATGRPVVREEPHHFEAGAGDHVAAFTYAPSVADASPDGAMTLIAPGGAVLTRMFSTAQELGFALRARGDGALGAAAGDGCLAFPDCRSLPAVERCAGCPSGGGLARVIVPVGSTSDLADGGDVHVVMRCTFEIEVRGVEPMRELLLVEAAPGQEARMVPETAWVVEGAWSPVTGAALPPQTYDALVASARGLVDRTVEPWVAMAVEKAADRLAPALRALRRRAEVQCKEAPTEARAIEQHLAREEAALVERHTVYVAVRLVNAAVLDVPARALLVSLDGRAQRVPPDAVCVDCGAPTADAIVDRGLHVVCPACAHRCASCGTGWCQACDTMAAECGVCRQPTCPGCLGTCSTCGEPACSIDVEPCDECGAAACYRCFAESAKDGAILCGRDTLRCAGGEVIGPSHRVETADGAVACEAHTHACGGCSRVFSEAALARTPSGSWVCPSDRVACARCAGGTWHLTGDLVTCAAGGESVCVREHAVSCSLGDIACSLHAGTCTAGHPVCDGHRVACGTGGETVCAEHARSCSVCDAVLCTVHGTVCPACGSLVCEREPMWQCDLCEMPTCARCSGPRCRACLSLARPTTPLDPGTVADLGLARAPMLVGTAGARLVVVEHGLVRSRVTVAEAGIVRARRAVGPMQRRGLGL